MYLLKYLLEAQGGKHYSPCGSESREHSKGLSHHKSPLLATLFLHLCRSEPHQAFQVHLGWHFSINFPLILQPEGASLLGMPAAAGGSLSCGTCHFLQDPMHTLWASDIHKGCAQDLHWCPDHNFHSSLWIIASTELGFSIQELSSLPFHFPHLFKHLLSYGSRFVFTKHQCFHPIAPVTALTGAVR